MRPVSVTVTHAGIARVRRYSLRMDERHPFLSKV